MPLLEKSSENKYKQKDKSLKSLNSLLQRQNIMAKLDLDGILMSNMGMPPFWILKWAILKCSSEGQGIVVFPPHTFSSTKTAALPPPGGGACSVPERGQQGETSAWSHPLQAWCGLGWGLPGIFKPPILGFEKMVTSPCLTKGCCHAYFGPQTATLSESTKGKTSLRK